MNWRHWAIGAIVGIVAPLWIVPVVLAPPDHYCSQGEMVQLQSFDEKFDAAKTNEARFAIRPGPPNCMEPVAASPDTRNPARLLRVLCIAYFSISILVTLLCGWVVIPAIEVLGAAAYRISFSRKVASSQI